MTGRICGTGSYVPARIVENEELANLVDTNDAWIRERTGIARRHLAETGDHVVYGGQRRRKEHLRRSGYPGGGCGSDPGGNLHAGDCFSMYGM
ncbi:MAG: hypothetical protein ACLUJR_12920 [Mediterraneibacter gnavus]